MMKWFLIFYLAGQNAGGPGVIPFPSREACIQAAATIKESKLGHRMSPDEWVCISERDGKSGVQ